MVIMFVCGAVDHEFWPLLEFCIEAYNTFNNHFICRVDVENTIYNGYCNHGDDSDVEDDDMMNMMMCDCFQNNTCNVRNMMFTCNQKGKLYSQTMSPVLTYVPNFKHSSTLLISKTSNT